MNRRRGEAGFTLVEMLIAIAIGAILMSSAFLCLGSAIRTRRVVADFSTPYAVGPAILDALEADLRNAFLYDMKENDAFWGVDADLNGGEADGLSFVTATQCQIGEPELKSGIFVGHEGERERRSFMTEVQYVCRRNPDDPGKLELWRREDFYVDDSIHDGGIYRLLYDRVLEFKLEYVARDEGGTAGGGLAGGAKGVDQMRQDGWNSIEEKLLPRAVIATVGIYARENEEDAERRGEPQVFVFRRWIPLPQSNEPTDQLKENTSWTGTYRAPNAAAGGAAAAR
ncbi:MAG TPA: prepilin-type N-terminal cleavage/methylation domain-containing protein, partial [Planctomycetota bacterium]|nr:prepilin-type N-terminal cleavage/methylation domain-containing protein [Planctomycetota bacterium]